MATGQIFSRNTQALFYNYKQLPIQRMLDFDFLCGRETPSVAGIINPGSEGFQKLFFGQEEIAIPVHSSIEAACHAHPTTDVFINFASFRSASASSMAALKQPTIKVVAIIAEGVPESDTKLLIAYARTNNKVVIGPATVGGIQAGAFKIGDTAGTIDNIIHCKLYRPGSVGFVSKSGGMSNELCNTIARVTDGIYEGIAIGGDVFPGSTLSDHVIRFNNISQAYPCPNRTSCTLRLDCFPRPLWPSLVVTSSCWLLLTFHDIGWHKLKSGMNQIYSALS